ncbi:hypothetical protein C7D73_31070, partial [Klebsiella pneumoniae]
FKDANELLDKLSAEKTLNPRGVVGLFPANAWATIFKDANELLDKLSAEKTLNPRGVVGLFPANAWAT